MERQEEADQINNKETFITARQQQIKRLYETLKRYSNQPKLYFKINEQIGNFEFLIADNLAPEEGLSGASIEGTLRFIKNRREFFGLPTQATGADFYQEHSFKSRMGIHYIIRLQHNDVEVEENSFIVHFDQHDQVVMISSLYQPHMKIELDSEALERLQNAVSHTDDAEQGDQGLNGLAETFKRLTTQLPPSSTVSSQLQLVPNWEAQKYEPRLQVKLKTPTKDLVFYYRADGTVEQAYPARVAAMPSRMGIGRIYRELWTPTELKNQDEFIIEQDSINDVMNRDLTTIVLQELQSDRELSGRYVTVEDNINMNRPRLNREIFETWKNADQFSLTSSILDRLMAYYHIDRIQRYFRDLGLTVLDMYDHLNPVTVVLDKKTEYAYTAGKQQIYFGRLSEDYLITDARDARIIYHEFTHAVTDALARLHRKNPKYKDNRRHRQILQAMAMNEGLADYFACSLAARDGSKRAHLCTMSLVNGQIKWAVRRLGPARTRAYQYDLEVVKTDIQNMSPECVKYQWGEQWARYLWKLRCNMGAEVADTVIAHSIIFLSRWATFGLGVLAIMLADRLLFQGLHEQDILEAGQSASSEWQVL